MSFFWINVIFSKPTQVPELKAARMCYIILHYFNLHNLGSSFFFMKQEEETYTPESKFFISSQITFLIFFPIWVFFHGHLRITGLQGKGEGMSLAPHYHFYPVHRHLDISWAITVDSSPLHIGSSRTGNLWFPSASCYANHLAMCPLSYIFHNCYQITKFYLFCDCYFINFAELTMKLDWN